MPPPLSRTLFRRERASIWRRAVRLLLLLVVLSTAAGGWFVYWSFASIRLGQPLTEVYVPSGASLRGVHTQLISAGVGVDKLPFLLLGRLTRSERSIRAGSYEVLDGMTPWGILRHLRRGKVVQSSVVFPEGWTFAQIRTRINANPDLRHESSTLSEDELLKRIGATETHPEGLFFPDTYLFDKGSSDLDLYRRSYNEMQRQLSIVWAQKPAKSPLNSPYEALILASIVEKETAIDADRPIVAAVFLNRLDRGMRLQTDPTVIYGLGATFDGNLRKRDLLAHTPYNTYVISGLPPTPIAAAGLNSLRAIVQPADSKALYFVARGDGSSEFSNTLVEHNRAVSRYQLKGGQK